MKSFNVLKENISNTLNFTAEIVNNYPNRLVGTKSCDDAAKRIAEEFEKSCDEGTVKIESFTCHPKSFLKYIRPAVGIYGISTLATIFNKPFTALAGYSIPMAMFTSQFVFYKEYFDKLFPKETGYNVWGSLEPEGEVKQQVIICGHHDAPYVFHLMHKSPKYYPLFIVAGVVPLVLGVIFSVYSLISGKNPKWIKGLLAAGTAGVLPLWNFTTDEIAPGAGDNMIASSMANETLKMFAEQKKKGNALKNTRVICLSVDAEESGLRGSRAFAKKHLKELEEVKTYALCIDTVYNADKLIFFDNDLNMTVDLSHEMAQELTDIATGHGYGAKVDHMPWGGGSTDAAAFGEVGIDASALLAFELDVKNLQDDLVYHTPNDTVDAIEPRVVEQCLTVIKDYIIKKDKNV